MKDVAIGHSVALLDVHRAEYLAMQDGVGEIRGKFSSCGDDAMPSRFLPLPTTRGLAGDRARTGRTSRWCDTRQARRWGRWMIACTPRYRVFARGHRS